MAKKRVYIPKPRHNPEYQARRLEKLRKDIDNHQRHIQVISMSHDNHITHLANFARHDVKNTIQNMDSILSTTSAGDFDENVITSLSTYLEVIRETMDNFAKLVPYSPGKVFKLVDLMVAVELLSRGVMQENKIDVSFAYSRQSPEEINLPFQSVLQMLNNLIINSVKALESVEEKKILISAEVNGEFLFINIKDNGTEILHDNCEKIFDYGYSTTGGSGIGLFHAKFLCSEFKGEVNVELLNDEIFTKTFSIKLPAFKNNNGKDSSDN